MRVETEAATAGRAAAPLPPAPARPRFDRYELALLGLFAFVSLWVLGLNLWQVVAHGRVWTGTDGLYLVDQQQYLAWIRSASHHGLIANLFVLRPTPADYFQPAVAVSAAVTKLGVVPWLALLLWKPVAVAMFFFAARAYLHRSLAGVWERRIALTLTLFFGCFTVVYGSFSVLGDLWPGFLSWGYVFALVALAAIVVALIRYDTARRQGRVAWLPGVLGALATLLHPWQGELLILIVLGGELMLGRASAIDRRRLANIGLTVGLTGLALLYYAILGRADTSWRLARDASRHDYPLWSLIVAVVPLLIPAVFAYRGRPASFLAAATRAWPVAVLALFFLSASALGATPLHAFQGITIPLAVLAIEGVRRTGVLRRTPHPRLAIALAVAVVTIPTTVWELGYAIDIAAPDPQNPTFIHHDEQRALNYLADNPKAGGVLTRSFLGALIPASTGRRVFVGDCLWSQPHCYERVHAVRILFAGQMPAATARTFVRQSGATFLLSDCESPVDLPKLLGPGMIAGSRRFGCARVYEVDRPRPATGFLAESGADAAVRATRRQ
ncbi:MAG: hypothetical protein ACJ76X_17320 [Solirubrobacteraceae bacterium]